MEITCKQGYMGGCHGKKVLDMGQLLDIRVFLY